MLFEYIQRNHFNKPDSLFIENAVYPAFTMVGLLVKDGYMSPNGANAIAFSKQLAIRKSFSEMIERRNLLLGGYKNQNDEVLTWDIIRNAPAYLPYEYTTYQTEGPYPSDTTGTATHPDSYQAVKIAIKELLEKNALFLFWYGKKGYTLRSNNMLENIPIYHHFKEMPGSIELFVNDSFAPLYVVFAIVYTERKIICCGVGSSFHLQEAIQKSLEEAYVLRWQKESNEILKSYLNEKYPEKNYEEQLSYLLELKSLPGYIYTREEININTNNDIRNCFPLWLTNLHVIILQNKFYSALKCVKVFSLDLYNHVPIKQYLRIERKINQETIKISEKELLDIPDCVFI
ncbi:YcaO-like family protein [Geobacillus stearothermophilus]|uniref:YcaO-like family protein n=1 Tax=Geobacillus stearothermophilus TaxID=1422 RepID=UPI0006AC4EB7|nr:YcaO-like family protein [Geobacillus stearothermophilus]KOR94823.1 hypothetical protein N231_05440 [Geobacillus stearothermophilus ATCC 12980]MED4880751.1 YcaO-like family protein [Geobacillus stearothermophilus]MED5010676.1 YcaO-like family protein [Geobacillus stearothermophilus]MED5015234.1 YcaO-like family protein [Geobacillus stearothermophilus]MED5045065.1 YcaO-like family protein [Geobacillus stearothermophilus]